MGSNRRSSGSLAGNPSDPVSAGSGARLIRLLDHSVPDISGKTVAKESQQSFLFRWREMKWDNVLIEVGVVVAATIVKLDNLFKRCQASIVHVRSALPDFPQARSLECAFVIGFTGDGCPALVLERAATPGHAGVVE